jgi:hypothetical protein
MNTPCTDAIFKLLALTWNTHTHEEYVAAKEGARNGVESLEADLDTARRDLATLRGEVEGLWEALGDMPNPQAAKEVGGITCNHPARLVIGSPDGYICCECWAQNEEATVRICAEKMKALTADLASAERERDAARALLNSPELLSFRDGVVLEAAHQRQRWPAEDDAGKTPADWFWLVGYLAGKALHAHASGNTEKALHHTISSAAALANWHAAILSKTDMRPGLPKEKQHE